MPGSSHGRCFLEQLHSATQPCLLSTEGQVVLGGRAGPGSGLEESFAPHPTPRSTTSSAVDSTPSGLRWECQAGVLFRQTSSNPCCASLTLKGVGVFHAGAFKRDSAPSSSVATGGSAENIAGPTTCRISGSPTGHHNHSGQRRQLHCHHYPEWLWMASGRSHLTVSCSACKTAAPSPVAMLLAPSGPSDTSVHLATHLICPVPCAGSCTLRQASFFSR